jgi:hypothetical protein
MHYDPVRPAVPVLYLARSAWPCLPITWPGPPGRACLIPDPVRLAVPVVYLTRSAWPCLSYTWPGPPGPTFLVSVLIRPCRPIFRCKWGVTKKCRLNWLTNSALAYEPRCGEGSCGVSANETTVHKSPRKLWRSNSIFNP